MELKTIYIMNYDVLRGTKDNLYRDLYKNIPTCFKQKKYICLEVESIPKVEEILLIRENGSLMAMSVFKIVYYEWKIFVIVNNTEGDLRLMEKESKDVPKFADSVMSS